MPSETSIYLLRPGQDDPAAASISDWMDQLGADLARIFERTRPGKQAMKVHVPGAGKQAGLTGGNLIFIVFLDVSFTDAAYLDSVQSLVESHTDSIRRMIRIDCALPSGEGLPEALVQASSINFGLKEAGQDTDAVIRDNDPAYWSKLVDLALELSPLLEQKKTTGDGGKAPAIFLAQAHADMAENRDILRRELMEYGFRILPAIDLGSRVKDLQSYVNQLADEAVLAIHLLGKAYGKVLRETGKSMPASQIDFLTTYLEKEEKESTGGKQRLSRLIWLDPDVGTDDSKQEELINQLKRNIEHLHKTEIVQTPLELFKSLVIKRLKVFHAEASSLTEAEGSRHPIYFIHAASDQNLAEKYAKGLSKQDLAVRMLDFSGKQKKLLDEHKSLLRNCESAVILYGDENRFWLRSKIMDLLKAPGLGRQYPMKSKQILVAGKDELGDYHLPANMKLLSAPGPEQAIPELVKTLK